MASQTRGETSVMRLVVEVNGNRVLVNGNPASGVHATEEGAISHAHSMLMRYGLSIATISEPTKQRRENRFQYILPNGSVGTVLASSRQEARDAVLLMLDKKRMPRGTKLERVVCQSD